MSRLRTTLDLKDCLLVSASLSIFHNWLAIGASKLPRGCPSGQYYSSVYSRCLRCDTCDQDSVYVQFCTAQQNTKCVKCVDISGNLLLQEPKCQSCGPCSEGYRVIRKCTKNSRTKCQRCPRGFFNGRLSFSTKCLPCTKCGVRETIVRCSPSHNAQCGGCKRGYYMDAGMKKCIRCQFCGKGGVVEQACDKGKKRCGVGLIVRTDLVYTPDNSTGDQSRLQEVRSSFDVTSKMPMMTSPLENLTDDSRGPEYVLLVVMMVILAVLLIFLVLTVVIRKPIYDHVGPCSRTKDTGTYKGGKEENYDRGIQPRKDTYKTGFHEWLEREAKNDSFKRHAIIARNLSFCSTISNNSNLNSDIQSCTLLFHESPCFVEQSSFSGNSSSTLARESLCRSEKMAAGIKKQTMSSTSCVSTDDSESEVSESEKALLHKILPHSDERTSEVYSRLPKEMHEETTNSSLGHLSSDCPPSPPPLSLPPSFPPPALPPSYSPPPIPPRFLHQPSSSPPPIPPRPRRAAPVTPTPRDSGYLTRSDEFSPSASQETKTDNKRIYNDLGGIDSFCDHLTPRPATKNSSELPPQKYQPGGTFGVNLPPSFAQTDQHSGHWCQRGPSFVDSKRPVTPPYINDSALDI